MGQTLPQAPQLLVLPVRSVHVAPQSVRFAAQVRAVPPPVATTIIDEPPVALEVPVVPPLGAVDVVVPVVPPPGTVDVVVPVVPPPGTVDVVAPVVPPLGTVDVVVPVVPPLGTVDVVAPVVPPAVEFTPVVLVLEVAPVDAFVVAFVFATPLPPKVAELDPPLAELLADDPEQPNQVMLAQTPVAKRATFEMR